MRFPTKISILCDVPFIKEELTRFVEQLTGHAPCKTGYPICVSVQEKGHENARVSVRKSGAAIIGHSLRGAVYGLYAFLERCVGLQFLAEDCTIFPPKGTATLKCGAFSIKPAFDYREVYWRGALDGRFALQMGLNSARADIPKAWGGKTMFHHYSHTFDLLIPPGEYFDAHPEYFSMVGGVRQKEKSQLCLTNTDLIALVAEKVRVWMRENPDCRIFSVAMNDWYSPCECEKCRAMDEREESQAGSMLYFVNQIAKKIEKEFPNNFIHTFAYLYCRKPPKTIKPRKNVIVRLCSIECCFSHPIAACNHAVRRIDVETTSAAAFTTGNRSFVADLEGWAAICKNLYIWDYTTNYANYCQPFPNIQVLSENLRLFKNCGVRGVFEQGNYAPGKASAFAALKIYLLSKLLWNPNEEVKKLTETFVNGYYGQAAAPFILDILKRSEEAVAHAHISLFDAADAAYLTPDFLREADLLFQKALAASASSQPHFDRISTEHLSIRYALCVAMPLDAPKRDAPIDAFTADVIRLGISELFERRELKASFACMKNSRYCLNRDNVPHAVYRL